MSVIDDYLATLSLPEKAAVDHIYGIVRQLVPNATEEISYAMPAFKYKGKGLVAIMVNKNFLSLYPFCAVDGLGVDLSKFECTSGSVHFSPGKSIPDNLFRNIIMARLRQING